MAIHTAGHLKGRQRRRGAIIATERLLHRCIGFAVIPTPFYARFDIMRFRAIGFGDSTMAGVPRRSTYAGGPSAISTRISAALAHWSAETSRGVTARIILGVKANTSTPRSRAPVTTLGASGPPAASVKT